MLSMKLAIHACLSPSDVPSFFIAAIASIHTTVFSRASALTCARWMVPPGSDSPPGRIAMNLANSQPRAAAHGRGPRAAGNLPSRDKRGRGRGTGLAQKHIRDCLRLRPDLKRQFLLGAVVRRHGHALRGHALHAHARGGECVLRARPRPSESIPAQSTHIHGPGTW